MDFKFRLIDSPETWTSSSQILKNPAETGVLVIPLQARCLCSMNAFGMRIGNNNPVSLSKTTYFPVKVMINDKSDFSIVKKLIAFSRISQRASLFFRWFETRTSNANTSSTNFNGTWHCAFPFFVDMTECSITWNHAFQIVITTCNRSGMIVCWRIVPITIEIALGVWEWIVFIHLDFLKDSWRKKLC